MSPRLQAALRLGRAGFALAVELDIPLHGVTAVFGPSGCGKTTLLRCLAGLEREARGIVRVAGETWQDSGSAHFLAPHRRGVGVVFQEGRLFDHLSVRGNLAYGWRRTAPARRRVAPEEAARLLGLEPLLDRRPQGLSGGERQRVAIARALAASPALLLLDEPTASLDGVAKREILTRLSGLARALAIPVLFVSHDLGEIVQLADSLVLMDGGRIVGWGALTEMLTRLDLPLAHAPDAAVVVEAVVVESDPEEHIDHMKFGADRSLYVARSGLAPGERARVRILARDVSLTLDTPGRTSILNLLPGQVVEVAPESPAQAVVKVDVGGAFLLARVTTRSLRALDLRPGLSLYAQVKSVALDR